MVDDDRQRLETFPVSQHMDVVEHEDEGPAARTARARREKRIVEAPTSLTRRGHLPDGFLHLVERVGRRRREQRGIVVGVNERYPDERPIVLGGPLSEQGRLAVARGGGEQHERGRARFSQARHQSWSPHEVGAKARSRLTRDDPAGARQLRRGGPSVPRPNLRSLDRSRAAEADVAGRAVRRVTATRRDPVAVAVGAMTQVGAASGDLHVSAWRALGVAPLRRPAVIARVKPIRAPFPDVSGRVVQPVAVRRELADRAGAVVAVVPRVMGWKPTLPDVHPVLSPGLPLVAPRKALPDQPSARGELPLGLGRKPQLRPGAKGLRIVATRRARRGDRVCPRSRIAVPRDSARSHRRPAATTVRRRRRASRESCPATGPRTRTTSRSARRPSCSPWRRRSPRSGDWSRHGPRSRTG